MLHLSTWYYHHQKATQGFVKEAIPETDPLKQNIQVSAHIKDTTSSEPSNGKKNQSSKEDTLEVSKDVVDLEASKDINIEAKEVGVGVSRNTNLDASK